MKNRDDLFNERLKNMIIFLERLLHEGGDFYVDDPLGTGEDFIKIGLYLVKNYVDVEDVINVVTDMWEEMPTEQKNDKLMS